VNTGLIVSWRRNFFAGLAVVLPGVISAWVIVWLFFTVSKITDTLLIFMPKTVTHADRGTGDLYWYWRVVALFVAVAWTTIVGLLARNYLGQRLIEGIDSFLVRVPLFNKIYGTTKQVNEALTSGNKTTFKTVVMIEYPRPGVYSVGFLTSEVHQHCTGGQLRKLLGVFIPTTPNPTSGFIVFLPEAEVVPLDMTVTEGFKFIVSLGAINPDKAALLRPCPEPAALPDARAND
jgi:uncharacterized membrane protein